MLKKILIKYKNWFLKKQNHQMIMDLSEILDHDNRDQIPVFIVCYNNGVHVLNMVKQLNKYKITPIIINNCSTDIETLLTLNKIIDSSFAHVIHSKKNFGHLIGFMDSIYALLPEVFAYTDPDLQLNNNLPHDFLWQLSAITEKYSVYKAGFALTLLDSEQMIDNHHTKIKFRPFTFKKEFNVTEWEKRFWRFKLSNPDYDLFQADIDTTFAVYRKSNFTGNFFDAIRVAGNFEAIHLPWYPNLDLIDSSQKKIYTHKNLSSSWLKK